MTERFCDQVKQGREGHIGDMFERFCAEIGAKSLRHNGSEFIKCALAFKENAQWLWCPIYRKTR